MTQGINLWRIAGWGMAVLLLLVPAIAMQFTREVNWSAGDFVLAAMLIGGVGLALEAAVRTHADWFYRGGAIVALAAAFLLVWINGAVGIVGDEGNPFNLLYLGIIVVALGWGVATRFRAAGLARAMTTAALLTIAIGAIGSYAGRTQPPGAIGIIAVSLGFATLFAVAAALFSRAAR